MIRKLLLSVLATFLLAPVGQAQTSSQTQPAAASRKVTCQGISSVPMTADAEQALPLNVVANLKCGEEVVVLSSPGGYTLNVRTADGRSGFVAVTYLKKLPLPQRTLDPSNLKNGVARWIDGSPGCSEFKSSDDSFVQSMTVEGVTVQVSLFDTGWKFRAQVAIANDSTQAINIEPSKFILDEIGPNGKPLFYNDPRELAKNTTHQVLWSVANAAPVSMPAYARFHSSKDPEASMLSYRSPTERPNSPPNYLLAHEVAESDAIQEQGKRTLLNYSKQVLTLALKPGVVPPTEMVSGAVWFDRSKNAPELMLRIPIEGTSFEFPLSFKQ